MNLEKHEIKLCLDMAIDRLKKCFEMQQYLNAGSSGADYAEFEIKQIESLISKLRGN